MAIVYQFEDGKIVFVTDSNGSVKAINIVADNKADAIAVADHTIASLKNLSQNNNDMASC